MPSTGDENGSREAVRVAAARRAAAEEVNLRVLIARVAALGGVAALAVLEFGFYEPVIPRVVNHLLQIVILAVYAVDVWRRGRRERHPLREPNLQWDDWALFTLAAVGAAANLMLVLFNGLAPRAGVTDFAAGVWWLFEVAAALLLAVEMWRLNVGLSRRLHRAGLLFPLSFLALIALGTPLLMVERAVPPGHESLSLVDALFTSTSAVCVTGLIVRDTAQLSPFGQTVICLLIQMGGLGIIVFGSVFAVILGGRLSLREDLTLSQMLSDVPLNRITAFVRFIVLGTVLIELIGAALLLPLWDAGPNAEPFTFAQRVGYSLFHSVSAFCNAGFALQSDSLVQYRYSLLVHTVFAALILVGGIGFPVLSNLWEVGKWRLKARRGTTTVERGLPVRLAQRRLNLHSKIVLTMTAVLYLAGVVGVTAAQLEPYFDGEPRDARAVNAQTNDASRRDAQAADAQTADAPLIGARAIDEASSPPLDAGAVGRVIADASFTSVTARTAGFNTTPMDEYTDGANFVTITLMMIGASPGSTGGGMKTTTVALLLLAVAATVRRRANAEAFGREVASELIHKAATLAACFIALVTIATLLLLISETAAFDVVLYEVVSAANTVGLTLGLTPELSTFGKLVIIVTMFTGRVGPLAILAVLHFRRGREQAYAYPREEVVIG